MSNALLPELPGQTWPRMKAPRFKTDVQMLRILYRGQMLLCTSAVLEMHARLD